MSTLLNILIVIVVWGCLFLALKINSSVKGGELSSPWLLISISFGLLSLGLILDFFTQISQTLVGLLKLGGLSVLALGFFYIRKVLT